MKNLEWHFITENQKSKDKAKQLADLLIQAVSYNTITSAISKYDKFEDSYSIKLTTCVEDIGEDDKLILLLLRLTSSVCKPWTIDFKEPIELFEMLFCKQIESKFSNQSFNVISLAHVQLVG
jgi:hypothetical protein